MMVMLMLEEEEEKEALILLGSLCASPWADTLPHELRETGLFLETQQYIKYSEALPLNCYPKMQGGPARRAPSRLLASGQHLGPADVLMPYVLTMSKKTFSELA